MLWTQAGEFFPDITITPASTSSATGSLLGKLSGETAMDRLWSTTTLYKNDDNSFIQLFQIAGLFHIQSIYGNAGGDSFNTSDYKDSGQNENVWGNDIEVRRARLGIRSKFFHHWRLDANFNIDVDGQDGIGGSTTFYKSLQDVVLTYAPSDQFNLGVGKRRILVSRDQEIISTEIVTVERSFLSNLLSPGELTGVWAFGKSAANTWRYDVGLFSNAREKELAQYGDGGSLLTGKIGYDFAKQFGLYSCLTTLTYFHNTEPGYQDGKDDPNFRFLASPSFLDAITLTNDISQGRFGMITEFLYGFGFTGLADHGQSKPVSISQSDLFGITLTTSYFLTEKLQAAYRFQFVSSADLDGIHVPTRYEQLATGDDEFGNTYVSQYLGLNYYIYARKLKLLGGVDYSHLGGGSYDGYTVMSGLRLMF
jgi:hypothetical protein